MISDNFLKGFRESRKLTRKQLSDKTKISVRTIIAYENGERKLRSASLSTIFLLCYALALDNPFKLIVPKYWLEIKEKDS